MAGRDGADGDDMGDVLGEELVFALFPRRSVGSHKGGKTLRLGVQDPTEKEVGLTPPN